MPDLNDQKLSQGNQIHHNICPRHFLDHASLLTQISSAESTQQKTHRNQCENHQGKWMKSHCWWQNLHVNSDGSRVKISHTNKVLTSFSVDKSIDSTVQLHTQYY